MPVARVASNRNSRVHHQELLNYCGRVVICAHGEEDYDSAPPNIIATIQRVLCEGKAALWICVRF
jgi:hypothetical protein